MSIRSFLIPIPENIKTPLTSFGQNQNAKIFFRVQKLGIT